MNIVLEMYSYIYRNLVFPIYEAIRRRNTYNYLKKMSAIPYYPIEELEEMRIEKLRKIVKYAYEHVPFYKRLFDEKGIDLDEINGIEDLRNAGVCIDKETVIEAGDDILSDEFKKEDLANSGTSGSIGQPVVFYMTMDNCTIRTAVKYRAEQWIGKPVGVPTTIIWGHATDMNFIRWIKYLTYWRFQNYQFISAFKINDNDLIKNIKAIKRNGSRFLECYVTVAYEMAKVIMNYNIAPPKLEGIIVGAEKLYNFQKETIEKAFKCPVYNRYGCTEFSNVASDCLEREGMHINMDRVWVEVIDKDGNSVVDEVGDLVITDLDNLAMPLIRYRIGDRGIISSEKCRCGINFPLLKDVVGRTSQILITPKGEEIHDVYFIWHISRTPGIKRFKIVQRQTDLLEFFLIQSESGSKEETVKFIESKLHKLLEDGIRFKYNFVDSIPLTESGKMLYFISEVKSQRDEKN